MSRPASVWLISPDAELEHLLDEAGFHCVVGSWPQALPEPSRGLRALAERPGRFDAIAFDSVWAVVLWRELVREAGTLGELRRVPSLPADRATREALETIGSVVVETVPSGSSVALVAHREHDPRLEAALEHAEVIWVQGPQAPLEASVDAAFVGSTFAAAMVAALPNVPRAVVARGAEVRLALRDRGCDVLAAEEHAAPGDVVEALASALAPA